MKNTLFTNDNLFILNGLNSELVDLIYIDPPFNSKRTYSAPVGSKAAGSSFKDMWTWQDVDDGYLEKLIEKYPDLVTFIKSIQGLHSKGMMSYCAYMTQRIIEMHRILKETGSFYLHCDPTASHYLKLILDEVFGRNNFRNEIIWSYSTTGSATRHLRRQHDVILMYSKTDNYTFNIIREKRYSKAKYRKAGVINYGAGDAEFFEDENGVYNMTKLRDVWDIPYINSQSKERTGYPTQKPLALLNRIIELSSQKGDIVFDAFCGCATACVAAQQLERKWIGIDIEKQAVNVLIDRLSGYDELKAAGSLFSDFVHRVDVPQRTDITIEPITKNTKQKLFDQQNGHCNGCNLEFNILNFEVDHIVPKAKGGGDYYENYQLLCGNCNKTKGDRPMEYLRIKIAAREAMLKNRLTFGE